MTLSHLNIAIYLDKLKIKTRPNAGHGLWLSFLLPSALILTSGTHPVIATPIYKLSSIFSVGLILTSLMLFYECLQNTRLKFFNVYLILVSILVGGLFRICLHREKLISHFLGLLFSCWSALMSTTIYYKLYLVVLEKLPKCFTLGEASIFCQSYIILIYFTILNVFKNLQKPATSVMQMSTLTIQIGLIGISFIIIVSYKYQIRKPFKFYFMTAFTFIFFIVLPLHFLLKINPLLWILTLCWDDLQKNRVLLYWILFSIIAIIIVNWRINQAKKASTSVRKIFHVLIIAVFIPGLLNNCSLLYLASGVVLGIFFMLEILRVLNMPPLAEALQNGIIIFADEKDKGIIAFTPMYLLAGCSLPLWLHPAPCDVTNSAVFDLLPLLSGLLTIGVGDTAASVVGSKIGRFHWKNSKKTIEGTVACILSQLLVIFIFEYLEYVKLVAFMDYLRITLVVIITSIIEAKTDQVDNLVLPFVMYIILVV